VKFVVVQLARSRKFSRLGLRRLCRLTTNMQVAFDHADVQLCRRVWPKHADDVFYLSVISS